MQGGLGRKTVLPVLGIVEGLFGLLVGHDGATVSGMKGVCWVERVSRMGRVQGVARETSERWRGGVGRL